MVEKTFVAIKPDGIQRGLIGRILQRFEDAGLKIVAMKMVWINEEFASKHYFDIKERRGENVFKVLKDFITEGPVLAMVLEGVEAPEVVRKMVGATEPKSALPGTIRGDFSHHSYVHMDKEQRAIRNLIHASANQTEAEYEINLWFKPEEIYRYKTVHELHTL